MVFVEVKTRTNRKFGEAKEAVNKKKQEHIRNVAEYFLYKNKIDMIGVRMDVIEVYLENERKYINHIKHAFE